MNRREKYQFLRSIGLSAELARKWRDRKIEKLESLDKNLILKNNKELKKELKNYEIKKRYIFLREIGLSSEKARKLRTSNKINVENLSIRKNRIVKNKEYYKLQEHINKEYPKLSAYSIEPEIKSYIKRYKDVENYGVWTKWGTLTHKEPYKHETYQLVTRIREIFGASEKQAYYILFLMYENGLSMEQILKIIETDPLYEIYEKDGK